MSKLVDIEEMEKLGATCFAYRNNGELVALISLDLVDEVDAIPVKFIKKFAELYPDKGFVDLIIDWQAVHELCGFMNDLAKAGDSE